jgi:hypothetical protein
MILPSIKQAWLNTCGAPRRAGGSLLGLPVGHQICQLWDCLFRDGEKLRIVFDSNARVTYCACGSNGRASTHEGVKDYTFTKRQGRTHYLAHESLWFEGRMWSYRTLNGAGRGAPNNVAKRLIRTNPTKAARFPLAKVVLNSTLAGLPEEAPWFPTGSWHDGHVFELIVGVLGAVSAAKSLNQADDLPALLETALNERCVKQLREKRICGYEHMPPGNEHGKCALTPLSEKLCQFLLLVVAENGESRKRLADAPTNGRRDSPNAATSAPEFGLLNVCVFLQTVGWIRHNSMNTIGLTALHPLEAIRADKIVGSFASLVERLGFSDSRCKSGSLLRLVTVVPKGISQDC